MNDGPIGFFDSGLGGLTCIPPLREALPGERIVYFGDTARTPYGSKAVATISGFAAEITDFLVKKGVKMIVIACNTVSATCLDFLQERHPGIPVVGIIRPAAEAAATLCTEENRIGLIGTRVTVRSGAYTRLIAGEAPRLRVYDKACPAFVPLIEEGILDHEIMDRMIRYYLDDFIGENRIDTLILGCTHYPLIRKNIETLYPGLRILNPSEIVVRTIVRRLSETGLLAGPPESRRTGGKGKKEDPLKPGPEAAGGSEARPRAEISGEKSEGNRDAGGNNEKERREPQEENLFYASDLSENFVNMIDRIFEESREKVSFRVRDLSGLLWSETFKPFRNIT